MAPVAGVTAGGEAVLPAAVAALLAAIAVWALRRFAPRLPVDRPGPRSLHRAPVSRVGGLAIWAGFVPVALAVPPAVPGPWVLWLGALAIVAGVSVLDDFRGVHPATRLVLHAVAALGVAFAILGAGPALPAGTAGLGLALATVTLMWGANLYNFMDGSDGLAATMALLGFGAYGLAAWHAAAPAAAYFALAGAILPFLAVNLPPARMFMGDVGAVPLGFLAAAFGLAGWRTGIWPAWFPLLVFLPFVADASATLGRRLLRRERVWEAHKMHYYQRVHQLGAGHRGTLLLFAVVMAGTGASALAALVLDPASGWLVLLGWSGVLAAVYAVIDYHWRHRTPAPQ